jgi:signal transduction histidine kinase/ActR/RegA family two-component response regulator
MKLKNSLQLSAVFPIALALIVSIVLVVRSSQGRSAQGRRRAAESVVAACFDLKLATSRLLLSDSDGSRQYWQQKHAVLAQRLAGTRPSEFNEQIAFDSVREQVGETREQFSMLPAPSDTSQAARKAKEGLYISCDTLLVDAFRFSDLTTSASLAVQERADLWFSVFIAVAGLAMAAATLSTTRSVVGRIRSLGRWSESVSAGETDVDTDVEELPDEIGQLSGSVARMKEKLIEEHRQLERELRKHRQVAEASRKSNMTLSEALDRLSKAQGQMIQQERLHALEQIAGGLIHNFNTALTPILGTSDLLLTYPDMAKDSKALREHLQGIRDAAKDARREIARLTDFFRKSKEDEGRLVDLNAVVEDAIKLTEPRWHEASEAEGIRFECKTLFAPLTPIEGNADDFREALVNLLINAIEAMPRGGTITVTTELIDHRAVIDIGDTGEGMEAEVARRCMEPFFSTKGQDGSGMGLAVVAGTFRRYGGDITFNSVPGEGTTFRIQLPTPKPRPRETTRRRRLEAVKEGLKVLHVDDEYWSRSVIQRSLGHEGHTVTVAASGEEGLQQFDAVKPDLVILDRAMPGMSGDELAAEIRRRSPETPIIMMTGFGDLMKDFGAHPPGVDLILAKPVTVEELNQAIARAFSGGNGD